MAELAAVCLCPSRLMEVRLLAQCAKARQKAKASARTPGIVELG